ncbi:MAG: hypothetical protein KKE83_09180 [Proteobacteria bacterium]|nr:hypothetical protein [Pseudomonadota bacterium]MBU1547564.1 hypothetical protein [Pseudomonadota bacterium]MBU2619846.1 hypothetical protein [Pseudomonadota bacterium]
MNIPAQSGQGPVASNDYQSLYSARSGKSTFEQTLAQTQSSSFSLTTAEGDQVTLSSLSQNYQYTHAIGWFNPASSGVNYASSSTSAEAMGISVQGDLNAQELADITRLVGELTSIASTFFSGDHEEAMTRAMDFGEMSMGSVSSFSASFSRQTVTQTRITSHQPLPAMADLNDLNLKDLYDTLGTGPGKELDYAEMLEARWQQILKALDEMKEKELDGLFARREKPVEIDGLNAMAEAPQPVASEPLPVPRKTTDLPIPTAERVAQQMLTRVEELLTNHPKLSPFAGPLAATAMEKAAGRSEQPDTAKSFTALQNAFRNRLYQWFLPAEPPATSGPLTSA